MDNPATVTQLLHRWREGDREAADALLVATYDQLRRLARGFLRNERADHTLQPTALVHEAYLQLFQDQPANAQSHGAFFALVAKQMRHQLIDYGRRRRAAKRGGGQAMAQFDEAAESIAAPDASSDEEVLTRLEEVLARFEVDHLRAGRVVRLKFFGKLSNEEVANALDISLGTVKREYAFARAWLARELDSASTAP